MTDTARPALSRVTINLKHLAAALPLAGSADIRYYLNGVCIVAKGDQLRTVATDGNVLGCVRDSRPATDIGDGEFIIPTDAVKALIKAVPKTLDYVTLERLPKREGDGPDVARWSCDFFNVVFTATAGKFPDWSRVMPSVVSGEVGQFNPELLARFSKAAKALTKKAASVLVAHNGAGAALVTLSGLVDFVGVVMPLRFSSADLPTPMEHTRAFRLV